MSLQIPQVRLSRSLRLVLIVSLLLITTWQAWWAERERRAPTVVAQTAGNCKISPDGRFLWIALQADDGEVFVEINNHRRVSITFSPEVPKNRGGLWLRDHQYLYSSDWVYVQEASGNKRVPINGWIIDPQNQMVTDVTTLDPELRTEILMLAAEQEQTRSKLFETSQYAPDGQLRYFDGFGSAAAISDRDDVNKEHNSVNALGYISSCIPGWRSDSHGYYFIDGDDDRRGPLRLLLTAPSPPFMPLVWLALGIGGSGAIYWYTRRRA